MVKMVRPLVAPAEAGAQFLGLTPATANWAPAFAGATAAAAGGSLHLCKWRAHGRSEARHSDLCALRARAVVLHIRSVATTQSEVA